jgi:hypothetical protein
VVIVDLLLGPGGATGGNTKLRGGEPVYRTSGPDAAAKQERSCHGHHTSHTEPSEVNRSSHIVGENCSVRGRFHIAFPWDPMAMATRRWQVSSGRGTAARVVFGITAIFALIELIYILLIVLGANQGNGFFRFISSLAEPLALFFPGLFGTGNYNMDVILNYGLAGVFWLVVGSIVARIIGR